MVKKKIISKGSSVKLPAVVSSPINLADTNVFATTIPEVHKMRTMGALIIGFKILGKFGSIAYSVSNLVLLII